MVRENSIGLVINFFLLFSKLKIEEIKCNFSSSWWKNDMMRGEFLILYANDELILFICE